MQRTNEAGSPPPGRARVRGRRTWLTGAASLAGIALLAGTATAAGGAPPPNKFSRTNLVANNKSFGAKLVDPNLTNAWGLAAAPDSPLWVSDNNSNKVTVYSGGVSGSAVSLDLTVPVPGGNPTGQVYNPTLGLPTAQQAFKVAGTPASFIVSSDSIGSTQSPGEIAAWNGGSKFVVEDSPTGGPGGKTRPGAVFKGLAVSANAKAGPELFAADVANATVDIFNRSFVPINAPGEFKDSKIPAGYAPFGIQVLGGDVYVAYAKQNASKTDAVPGSGLGYVDVYSSNGILLKHLVVGGPYSPLNEPWGLAIAPAGFGPFAAKLLVGNLGNGWINAFNPTTGAYLGYLKNTGGGPVVVSGLWGLRPGSSGFGGTGSLVFSAGPAGYANGVVGTLTPAG